jgi:16S rRNA G527 N7-methylase RsmG
MSTHARPALPHPAPGPLPCPDGLEARLESSGIRLHAAALPILGDYLARLLAMNADMNLTAITDPGEAFLSAVASALELSNVAVRAERAERLGPGETFHAVTARAVARLTALVPLTAPLARPGGLLLLVKGQRADQELAEAGRVLAQHGAVHERTVATPTGRIIVLRRQASRTSSR